MANGRARTTRLKGSRAGRKNLATAMKRTSARGAYKPAAKRNMMIRRSPFVETKSKTYEDLQEEYPHILDHLQFTTRTQPVRMLNPEVFLIHQQGLDEHQVIGKSIYARYMNMKLQIRFPQAAFETAGLNKIVPLVPQDYELIWGWVPNPLQATGQTTPSAPDMTLFDINTHINTRVRDYMDQQKDRLRFIPKQASTLRIVGRKKIRPNLNRSSTAPAQTIDAITGADYVVGSIPDVHLNISWKLKRKLHLEHATNLVKDDTKPSVNHPGLFPNYSWLPFCAFVNWDYDNLPASNETAYMPSIAYNSILYYQDS
jgi:hypothetical protein